jgi:hypothetical protein
VSWAVLAATAGTAIATTNATIRATIKIRFINYFSPF